MPPNQNTPKARSKKAKEEQSGEDPSNGKDLVVQKATGLTDPKLTSNIIGIILKSLPGIEHAEAAEREQKLNMVIALLEQISPRDATEGMLAAQMIACHEHALECMRNSQYKRLSQKARFENHRQAARLLEIYRKQFQALSKYRENRAAEDHRIMLQQKEYEDRKPGKSRLATDPFFKALLEASRSGQEDCGDEKNGEASKADNKDWNDE
jgi:hypothetical protein